MTTTTPATAASIEATERFEHLYADAGGDASRIPWSDGVPNPALVAWLDAVAPALLRCGARVAVVGCGLGEDARELIQRGYEVTAFDISQTAIDWARSLDPDHATCYHCADLFDPPARWRHRFDLVVEVYTIQSLSPGHRPEVMRAIVDLVSPNGHLLAIARASAAPVGDDDGPPWPLTRDELVELAGAAGLLVESMDAFLDDEDPPKPRLRGLFHRA